MTKYPSYSYKIKNKTNFTARSFINFLKKKKNLRVFHFQINRIHIPYAEIDQKDK